MKTIAVKKKTKGNRRLGGDDRVTSDTYFMAVVFQLPWRWGETKRKPLRQVATPFFHLWPFDGVHAFSLSDFLAAAAGTRRRQYRSVLGF